MKFFFFFLITLVNSCADTISSGKRCGGGVQGIFELKISYINLILIFYIVFNERIAVIIIKQNQFADCSTENFSSINR